MKFYALHFPQTWLSGKIPSQACKLHSIHFHKVPCTGAMVRTSVFLGAKASPCGPLPSLCTLGLATQSASQSHGPV